MQYEGPEDKSMTIAYRLSHLLIIVHVTLLDQTVYMCTQFT